VDESKSSGETKIKKERVEEVKKEERKEVAQDAVIMEKIEAILIGIKGQTEILKKIQGVLELMEKKKRAGRF